MRFQKAIEHEFGSGSDQYASLLYFDVVRTYLVGGGGGRIFVQNPKDMMIEC